MKGIKERIPALMVVLGIIIYTTLLLIIGYVWASNKFEDDIAESELENIRLAHRLQESYNTIEGMKKRTSRM